MADWNSEDLDLMFEDDLQEQESERESEKQSVFQFTPKESSDAYIWSINTQGRIDLEKMAEVSGIPEEKLVDDLCGSAMFQNPPAEDSEYDLLRGWQPAQVYLSGNLHKKYKEAKTAAEKHGRLFERNLQALAKKMPAKISIDDIYVSLGARWVPVHIYDEFITGLLGFYSSPGLSYNEDTSTWKIEWPGGASYVENNYTYGVHGLTGTKIIEQTMNAKTVKVYDQKLVMKDGEYKTENVLNKAKTIAAQDKQKSIIDAFQDWIHSDIHIMDELEECYNMEFCGYAAAPYDGSFLSLPEINPDVHLYPHQKDAVARILCSDHNVLLAHEVGTGKTFEMVVGAHERRRLGLSKKAMTVVPNNVLQDVIAAHRLLYPNDKILPVLPKDFVPSKRREVLEKIRDEDFTVCYMAYSSFDMIKMSMAYRIEESSKKIKEVGKMIDSADTYSVRKQLENRKKRLSEQHIKLRDLLDENALPGYDQLGIDLLTVDEAHNYKNIPLLSKADNIVGMHNNGSVKSKEMLDKCSNTEKVVFATGTPLTNSLADLYVLQKYLQPDDLADHQIDNFDQWINTFAQRETSFEVDVDAVNLRVMTRFSTFHNLNELMALFSQVCDFHYLQEHLMQLPRFDGYTDIQVPKSKSQDKYIKSLGKRTDKIRSKKVNRKVDNLLKVTIDGRACALDPRLVEAKLLKKEESMTKIAHCARMIMAEQSENPGCAQLVFSDLGTPKEGFNVYDELKKQLMLLGMPEEKIRYIHEAKTEAQRTKLFKQVNSGEISVLIGSTPKLGLGVNVQEKLAALHHLSIPWRPADLVQREGRIIRQGNMCDKVHIYRYVTEGSFDSYSWQLLENKQKFISAFLSNSMDARHAQDISDTVLSYADIKAMAIGNPLVKQRVETSNRLERAKTKNRQREKQLFNLKNELKELPSKIQNNKDRNVQIEADKLLYEKHSGRISRAQRQEYGEQIAKRYLSRLYASENTRIGTYRGFELIQPGWSSAYHASIQVKNYHTELPFPFEGVTYTVNINLDKPSGITLALDYLLSHLQNQIDKNLEENATFEKNIERAKIELEKGNEYIAEVVELEEKLAGIDEKLSDAEKEALNADRPE